MTPADPETRSDIHNVGRLEIDMNQLAAPFAFRTNLAARLRDVSVAWDVARQDHYTGLLHLFNCVQPLIRDGAHRVDVEASKATHRSSSRIH